MTRLRLYRFLAGPELGLTTTVVFALLYCWPFLVFNRASKTFVFLFAVWVLHVALIALMRFACCRLPEAEQFVDRELGGTGEE